jgi:hypothetical protein
LAFNNESDLEGILQTEPPLPHAGQDGFVATTVSFVVVFVVSLF